MEVQEAVGMAAALRAVQQAAAEVALGAARQEVVRGWEEAVMGMAEEVTTDLEAVAVVVLAAMEQAEGAGTLVTFLVVQWAVSGEAVRAAPVGVAKV